MSNSVNNKDQQREPPSPNLSAYREGYRARGEGLKLEDCPYDVYILPWSRLEWRDGWFEADCNEKDRPGGGL